MDDKRIRHVPVVIDDGVLAGVVSIRDIVNARLQEAETERLQMADYISNRTAPEPADRAARRRRAGRARFVRNGRAGIGRAGTRATGRTRSVGQMPVSRLNTISTRRFS